MSMRVALYLPVALYVLLATACATTGETGQGEFPSPEPELARVRVSALPDGRLRLAFSAAPLDPALRRFSKEDARRVLEEFHGALAQIDPRLLQTAAREVCSGQAGNSLGKAPSGKLF